MASASLAPGASRPVARGKAVATSAPRARASGSTSGVTTSGPRVTTSGPRVTTSGPRVVALASRAPLDTVAAATPARDVRAAATSETALERDGFVPGDGVAPQGFSDGMRGGGAGLAAAGDGYPGLVDRAKEKEHVSRGAPAHLLGAGNPCADLFPYAARSDSGIVAVALDVATNGQPLESHIVEEAPRGQGFALAAHRCVRRLRFSPALDAEGHAVASRSVVRLRFARHAASRAIAL